MPADGDQAVDEVGVQRLEGGVIGPQHVRQAVLGDEEVDEHADPAGQGAVRPVALRQQHGTGFGAGLDLVPVDGDDQVGSRREVPVDRADAHAGPGRDVAHRHVDPGLDECCSGRLQQRRLIPPGVGPLARRCRPQPALTAHYPATSIAACQPEQCSV